MMPLAYRGGKPIITTPIRPRDTLSSEAKMAMRWFWSKAEGWNLSGYLAGSPRGGMAIQRLETLWSEKFQVRHSIACNSATSALLAAIAVLRPKRVHVPVMGMSAVAAVPKLLGCEVVFQDIDEHYCIRTPKEALKGDVILAVNLFGHPAQLRVLREFADERKLTLLEDNAQGYAAQEDGVFCGTIGNIGIWSGNVHKPWNVGEGGMLTTNDDFLERALRGVINHGEVHGGPPGLNLRMNEDTAVLGIAQMESAQSVVNQSRDIWHALSDTYDGEFFTLPTERDGCKSAWYCLAIQAPDILFRDDAVAMLQAEGLPCRAGYVRIDQMPAFKSKKKFPVADDLNDRLILIELCSIDPTEEQIVQMGQALNAVGEELDYGSNKICSRIVRQSRGRLKEHARARPRRKAIGCRS